MNFISFVMLQIVFVIYLVLLKYSDEKRWLNVRQFLIKVFSGIQFQNKTFFFSPNENYMYISSFSLLVLQNSFNI